MKTSILSKVTLLVFCFSFCMGQCYSQTDSAAMANADTTNFSVNKNDGWQLFNSYVSAVGTDSVMLEMTIQHVNNLNWSEEQHVGRITNMEFLPASDQTAGYSLINKRFVLRVDQLGECYLRLAGGAPPEANPAVIPVRVTYKK